MSTRFSEKFLGRGRFFFWRAHGKLLLEVNEVEHNYLQELADLKAGSLTEIPMTRDEFLVFRDVWMTLPDKADFRGIASLNGAVTFVYDSSANPVNQKADD